MSERRAAATSALRELRVELEYRRSELAALERTADVLERQADQHVDGCDCYHPDKPCAGELYSRFCRVCDEVVKRCQEHGGIRAASYAADAHRAEEHAGQHARLAETDQEGRLRTGSKTVSMGGLSAPSRDRGRGEQGHEPQDTIGVAARRASNVDSPQPTEPWAGDHGAPAGLESSAAQLVVQRWIEDATEPLSSMMYTCSLDVVRDYPDGLAESSAALLLGVTGQAINAERRIALRKFRVGLAMARLQSGDL